MGKEKLKRATKESLLARAQARKENETKYINYECESLGETLIIKKLPLTRIADILDMSTGDSIRESIELNTELIYASIPLFHDSELQEAYECKEPTDIVLKVLDDNLAEISKICDAIMELYGLEDIVSDIKN